MPRRSQKSRLAQAKRAEGGDLFARASQRGEGGHFETEDFQETDSSEVVSSHDEKCWEEDIEVSGHDSDDEACATLIETLSANSAKVQVLTVQFILATLRVTCDAKGLALGKQRGGHIS